MIAEQETVRMKRFIRTCIACPSQWEGELDDGRWLYVRYRGGRFSVSWMTSEGVIGERFHETDFGDRLDGWLSDEEMLTHLPSWIGTRGVEFRHD